MLILHDPRCADYGQAGHPERPGRILESVPHLRRAHPGWAWRAPAAAVPDSLLLLAHTEAHVRRLAQPRPFDPDTPFFPDIGTHARRGVSAALDAARHAVTEGGPAFSLMRPPGHHATPDRAMGFCYLNQVAIAALAAQRDMGVARVAVWDFDAHHGNGTEEILLDRPGFLYCSVHQHPAYPDTGQADRGNSRSWPIPPDSAREGHMKALRASWEAVMAFEPGLVLVSAGFDAYAGDPITDMSLQGEDFATLGAWLREAGLPTAAALEGGYSGDLPLLMDAFLGAWAAR
jgi:acetoin utilization deacetylase AcuC-like enzyme